MNASAMVKLGCSFVLLGFAVMAHAQGPTCPVTDAPCLQTELENACRVDSATDASCSSWLAALEHSPVSKHANARLMAAAANIALSDRAGELGANKPFRDRAKKIYSDLVADDPTNTEALTGLAALSETRDQQVALFRRVVEVNPNSVRALEFLSRAVGEGSSEAELRESAELLKRAYDLQPSGLKRWNIAEHAISRYERAGLSESADRLRDRVKEDFGLRATLIELASSGTLSPDRVTSSLQSICRDPIPAIVGPKSCLDGIQDVVNVVDSAPSGERAARLAEGAAEAMSVAVDYSAVLDKLDPGWRSRFEAALARFVDLPAVSSMIYNAYAHVTTDKKRRLEILQMAAARYPSDGEVALGVGLALIDLGRRAEATDALSRARDLLPAQRREHVDRLLTQAAALPN